MYQKQWKIPNPNSPKKSKRTVKITKNSVRKVITDKDGKILHIGNKQVTKKRYRTKDGQSFNTSTV